jgi:hypothetical protein
MKQTHYKILECITQGISTIEHWENGIVCIKTLDYSQTEVADVKFQLNYIKAVHDGKNGIRILSEPGLYSSISKEARELSSRPEANQYTKASAVVVKSLAQRLLVNFIVTLLHKQRMKMKVFDSREKAIDWLLSIP